MKTTLGTCRFRDILFFVMFTTTFRSVSGCEPCHFAVFTVLEVDSCPENEHEWADRAAKKNCERYALKQKCSKPEQFKYHCAVNELENTLIEVCAKEHLIMGGVCTEYNEIGRTIQGHDIINNKDVKPSCPEIYWSSQAYRCKGCNNFVRNITSSPDIIQKPMEKDSKCGTSPPDIIHKPMENDCKCGFDDGCVFLSIIVGFESVVLGLAVVGGIFLFKNPRYILWIPTFRNLYQAGQPNALLNEG